ncbi:MAG: YbhB/YbcL family Raf kinase inhibitor-like protein [Gemmataceae bacterium]|nr:YbhB/YbcL family Raf kinase inhibitor-like protein [Gemmataceae bacterium]
MKLQSSAFADGSPIPKKYTGDGPDVSPPLEWTDIPPGTQSLVLICDDPDAPRKTWVHWVLYNLPAGTTSLAEAVPPTSTLPNGAVHGTNDFGRLGYGGPAPPRGKPHRYFFKLYALDAPLKLPAGATKAQVEQAMKGHVLAEAQWMGTYQR